MPPHTKKGKPMSYEIITPPNTKSRYWKYFGFWGTENGEIVNKDVFVCKICRKTQRYHANTSNLREHLRSYHREILKELEDIKDINPSFSLESPITSSTAKKNPTDRHANLNNCTSMVVHAGSSSTLPPDPSNLISSNLTFDLSLLQYNEEQGDVLQESRAACLASFLAEDLQPLKTIEKNGFMRLLQSLDPSFQPPSRELVENEIKKMYDVCFHELLSDLHKTDGMSLALEKWSSSSGTFITITVHFINSNWEAESRILKTQMCEEGVPDIQYLKNCLEMYHLHKKVMAVTVKTGGMPSDLSQDQIHIPIIECFASFLNRCICEAMQECQKVQSIINKFRLLHGHVSSSPMNATLFEKQQIIQNLPCQKLLKDSKNSWMSTYDMIIRAEEQQGVIDSLISDHKLEISKSEWDISSELIRSLNVAKAASKALLTQKYPSASSVLPLFYLLIDSLSSSGSNESTDVQEFREYLLGKLQNKYSHVACADLLNLASFCDPRFKTLFHLSEDEKQTFFQVIRTKLKNTCSAECNSNSVNETPPPVKRQRTDISLMEDLLATFSEPKELDRSKQFSEHLDCSEKCEFEISTYLAEERLPLASDPLDFWRDNEQCYPSLSKIARKYLCITASCVPSMSVFKPDNENARSQLEPEMIDILMFLHDHFQSKG